MVRKQKSMRGKKISKGNTKEVESADNQKVRKVMVSERTAKNVPSNTLETRVGLLSAAILSSSEGNCLGITQEECEVICEDILDSSNMVEALCDYLDLSEINANGLLKEAFEKLADNSSDDDNSSRCDLSNDESTSNHDDDSDDVSLQSNDSVDDYIKEGECQLCERELRLTLHHLIPKVTWKHIKPRFLEAAEYYRKGDIGNVKKILDLGDELPFGLSPKTFKSGIAVKLFLAGYTARLCAPCHSSVHKYHDNMELAEKYNTVDKLLEDERIYKFCQWQSKQKAGKYKLRK